MTGEDRGKGAGTPLIRVAGLHLGGSGYPNARGTLAVLREQLGIDIRECGQWLPADFRLWQVGRASPWSKALMLCRLLAGNAISLLRLLAGNVKHPAPVYVPYPSVFLLWMLSWIPRRWRPVTIVDAYISLWDSMVLDRGQVRPGGLLAHALHRFERRALRIADRVLVDTVANERFYVERFGLDPGRLRSFPLVIDEVSPPQSAAPLRPPAGALRVLFVGTFIPLHGLVRALGQLTPLLTDERFEFLLVGDGQEAPQVRALLDALTSPRIRWIREWQSPEALAAHVREADVCLGVFGGPGKAARVLPFKVYLYLAMGKPVLTQAGFSVPAGAAPPPVVGIDPDVEGQMNEALLTLLQDPALRARLGTQGATYYLRYLGRTPLAECWCGLLAELTSHK